MKTLLEQFEAKAPEITFEWNDSETEAKGWIVINSLRGGAAGGGTRMRKNLDKREVESLAKTMEIKFTVAGPAIGGAKSGIDFDPSDPRKNGVLRRWYKAVKPILKEYYGTGGDLNVDEIHEVIPITGELGILHPQEGVVSGYYGRNNPHFQDQIENLKKGVLLPVHNLQFRPEGNQKITVADLITGYGVAESVKHFGALYEMPLQGKRAIIQGWGNVGAAAAWYLSKMGVKITGIIDRNGGVINLKGFRHEEITQLFLNKNGNELVAEQKISFEEINRQIWESGAEIFIPAAASRLVTMEQVETMIQGGLQIISAGANVPFADQEIFFGPIARAVDQKVAVIPDFIANCGMARVFAYLMEPGADCTDEAIFADVSHTMEKALMAVKEKNRQKINLTETAYSIALHQLIKA
jgi:glutamate dehydrogenase/leucine dehydrogenase